MRFLKRVSIAVVLCGALCVGLVLASTTLVPRCTAVDGHWDAAVILGGSRDTEKLYIDSQARLDAGLALFERGRVDHLVMTGAGPNESIPVGRGMLDVALSAGVPRSALSEESRSQSTLENALFATEFLKDGGSVLVVSEPLHALRGAAALSWATGRPASSCASELAERPAAEIRRLHIREVAAWGFNIIRASAWSLASAVGVEGWLPDHFLS